MNILKEFKKPKYLIGDIVVVRLSNTAEKDTLLLRIDSAQLDEKKEWCYHSVVAPNNHFKEIDILAKY